MAEIEQELDNCKTVKQLYKLLAKYVALFDKQAKLCKKHYGYDIYKRFGL